MAEAGGLFVGGTAGCETAEEEDGDGCGGLSPTADMQLVHPAKFQGKVLFWESERLPFKTKKKKKKKRWLSRTYFLETSTDAAAMAGLSKVSGDFTSSIT